MGNENGVWIMHGLPASDPNCIRSPQQLEDYIDEVGFLPLFKNEIPGFSVEEHTQPGYWWSGDRERDPWEWRGIVAAGDRAAYGKFFNKKAGFISKAWLPYFINCRRDGYDFDARWEDEKASYRQTGSNSLRRTAESSFSTSCRTSTEPLPILILTVFTC